MAVENPARAAASSFPTPAYLPPAAAAALPWTRRYVTALTTRHQLCLEDAWDEAVTALLRACVHFRPGAGTFHAYARTTVIRGLWRYCRRATTRHPPTVSLDVASPLLVMPSTETVACLRDPVSAPAAAPPPPHRHPAPAPSPRASRRGT